MVLPIFSVFLNVYEAVIPPDFKKDGVAFKMVSNTDVSTDPGIEIMDILINVAIRVGELGNIDGIVIRKHVISGVFGFEYLCLGVAQSLVRRKQIANKGSRCYIKPKMILIRVVTKVPAEFGEDGH